MYAIIEVSGFQFKVSPDSTIRIPRVQTGVGEVLRLDHVLLVSDGKQVAIGQPYLEGKQLEAEILRHGKEKKITVFKKKRRKKYRKKRGHRQQFTEIMIKGFPL
jgi:large subunit ribosomal protein L21